MLPFLWATSTFQKVTMTLKKWPNWCRIAQSGHPEQSGKSSSISTTDFEQDEERFSQSMFSQPLKHILTLSLHICQLGR